MTTKETAYSIQIAWAGSFEVKETPSDLEESFFGNEQMLENEVLKFTNPKGEPIMVHAKHFCGMYPTP